MKYAKTIVCYANSRKHAARCVAGKEWHDGTPGEWVRAVSDRPTHEVSAEERLIADAYRIRGERVAYQEKDAEQAEEPAEEETSAP